MEGLMGNGSQKLLSVSKGIFPPASFYSTLGVGAEITEAKCVCLADLTDCEERWHL